MNSVVLRFLDALGTARGFSIILVLVGTLRQLFGTGKLLGYTLDTPVDEGGRYQPNGLRVLAPRAFFIIGLIIWAIRTWKTDHVEKPAYRILEVHRTEVL